MTRPATLRKNSTGFWVNYYSAKLERWRLRPFNRRSLLHWGIAAADLWCNGKRPAS